MSGTSFHSEMRRLAARYLREFPDEVERLQEFQAQLARPDDLRSRKTMPGHLTVGALIVRAGRREILLVRHRALGLWMQPGGHFEPGEYPAAAALREAIEETGIAGLSLDPWHEGDGLPLDIDSHPIPASERKGEPAHLHHDLRYLFHAPARAEVTLAEEEVTDWRWVPLAEAAAPEASFEGTPVADGLTAPIGKIMRLKLA